MTRVFANQKGFTLIELVVVIIIAGILVAIAVRKIAPVADSIKTEAARQEMDLLAIAIVGNPDLRNNGVRTDFGYVGDVGAMPPDLEALRTNPGSYTTWKGPYIDDEFVQATNDFKKDAWNSDYTYSAGVTITSTGSGSDIIRKLAGTTDELLRNQVTGNLFDLDGTPPGNIYKDSLTLRMTVPDGAGGTVVKTSNPDGGGFFSFDSIPIGNHDLEIIYIPDNDTIRRFVVVTPNSELYNQYQLVSNVWIAGGSSGYLTKVGGSDSLVAGCKGIFFWIVNNSGSTIDIDSITLTWSSPTAYYRYVKWGGVTVFNRNSPKAASGETVALATAQSINDGVSLRVDLDGFKANPTGGAGVNMNGVTFTVEFSDGSSMTVTTGSCP